MITAPENWPDRSEVRRFLLDASDAAETDRIAQVLVLSESFAWFVEAVEAELASEYVRENLSVDDRRRFEERLSRSPGTREQVEFARTLEGVLAKRKRRPRWPAFAAAVAAMLAPILFWLGSQAPVQVASLVVRPGLNRGGSGLATHSFAAGDQSLIIEVELSGPCEIQSSLIRIESVDKGTTAWSGNAACRSGRLNLTVPRTVLPSGDYVIHGDGISGAPFRVL
ncbi:MAG: hypothetical protein FJW40_11145 [Acidobacteria bacterium]|nr:hypothetical protein [Acidobacteriota bacterium]